MVATDMTVVVLLDEDSEFQAYRKLEQAARMWEGSEELSLLSDAIFTAITPLASGITDREAARVE